MRISSCTRSRRSFRDLASPWITMGSAMMAPMVMRGFREAYGSWKIICMRRRMRRISTGFMRVRSWPSKTTSPEVGLYSMRMTRPRVVLPQPLSPTSPSSPPRLISKLTPSTALTSATLRWKMIPEVTGKYIRMSSTRTIVSPPAPAEGGLGACSTNMLSPSPPGPVVKLQCRGRLHDLPRVHHVHPVGVARNDAQVVGDDDHGGAQLSGQAGQQLQDLGLDGHVQRRRRLIGEEELWVAGERHRGHDALAQSTGGLGGGI